MVLPVNRVCTDFLPGPIGNGGWDQSSLYSLIALCACREVTEVCTIIIVDKTLLPSVARVNMVKISGVDVIFLRNPFSNVKLLMPVRQR